MGVSGFRSSYRAPHALAGLLLAAVGAGPSGCALDDRQFADMDGSAAGLPSSSEVVPLAPQPSAAGASGVGAAGMDVSTPPAALCPFGTHDCFGVCQPNTSAASCGNSCVACPVPPGGEAYCDGLECSFSCAAGTHACGMACVSNDSVATCGSSCSPCPVPAGGSATCDGTICGGSCLAGQKLCAGACIPESEACLGTCPAGTHDCDGVCLDDTSTNSCGSSCTPCPAPAESTATCEGAACGFTCRQGFHRCGQACVPNTSTSSCGNSCAPCPAPSTGGVATCDGSSCGVSCSQGFFAREGCHAAARQISAGGQHTCATLSDGSVRCWGWNDSGQLGAAAVAQSQPPAPVAGLTGVLMVGTGRNFSCALLAADGSVRCWGANDLGQLGNGTTTPSSAPVSVSGITGATSLDVADLHSCVLLASGGIRCWGYNGDGELGDGTRAGGATPVAVAGLAGTPIAVAAGGGTTCALLSDRSVSCWGNGGSVPDHIARTPAIVTNVSNVSAISNSGAHACALLSGGSVTCWGFNTLGQLGNGLTATETSTPVAVLDVSGVTALAIGNRHSCALLASGEARCWGDNGSGHVGAGLAAAFSTTPLVVQGLTGASSIDAGGDHTCAIVADGSARCWGYNGTGALGDGTIVDASRPVATLGW